MDTDELIRRASEGCEGPMDDPCFKTKIPLHLWCDPCRCQEAAKIITAERATVDALTAALREMEADASRREQICREYAAEHGRTKQEASARFHEGAATAFKETAQRLAVLLDERGSR
jgi:hypothetical protein